MMILEGVVVEEGEVVDGVVDRNHSPRKVLSQLTLATCQWAQCKEISKRYSKISL